MNVRGQEELPVPGALQLVSVGDRAVHVVEEVSDRLARAERGFEAWLSGIRLHDGAVERHLFRSSWEVAGAGIVGVVAAVAALAVQIDSCAAGDGTADPTGPGGRPDRDPARAAAGRAVDELLAWGVDWAATMTDDLIIVTELLLTDLHLVSPPDDDGESVVVARTALKIVLPEPADDGSPS